MMIDRRILGIWAKQLGMAGSALVMLLSPVPATAQAQGAVRQVDPNAAYEVPEAPAAAPTAATGPVDPVQSDIAPAGASAQPTATAMPAGPVDSAADGASAPAASGTSAASAPVAGSPTAPVTSAAASTYKKDDLIGAAQGVFGKGAKGLAELIEKILKDQGEPNAYIAGREASGAFVLGLRYGSGTMIHKVEGQRPVYWTGPSLGVDIGGDATKTFVLVYNLYDSQDLYARFAQIEGRAYFVGGLSATYLQRGNVVVIPIRMGVGMRLGANIGYMKFSEKAKWLPF
ncbi:MAG: DUF1134 domain-containing protein [Chakrabartia sp.]